jgi:hypothetical protein
MDAIEIRSALVACTHVMAFAALLLYLMRASGNRVMRGYPLIFSVVLALSLCATGWTIAALDNFARPALRLAMATTVPLVQMLFLMMGLKVFVARVGRDPSRLPTHQFAGDTTADTLMHAFVLFVVTIGAIVLIATLRP